MLYLQSNPPLPLLTSLTNFCNCFADIVSSTSIVDNVGDGDSFDVPSSPSLVVRLDLKEASRWKSSFSSSSSCKQKFPSGQASIWITTWDPCRGEISRKKWQDLNLWWFFEIFLWDFLDFSHEVTKIFSTYMPLDLCSIFSHPSWKRGLIPGTPAPANQKYNENKLKVPSQPKIPYDVIFWPLSFEKHFFSTLELYTWNRQ